MLSQAMALVTGPWLLNDNFLCFRIRKRTLLQVLHNAYSENKAVERYLSPESGSNTTIVLPSFSGRFAS